MYQNTKTLHLKARYGKFFKKCREHKTKIVKASSSTALVNPMSCAGRNYREVLNAMTKRLYIMNGIQNVMK